MKLAAFAIIVTSAFLNLAQAEIQTADIGFERYAYYIAVKLLTVEGQDARGFSFRRISDGKDVKVSNCAYLAESLKVSINEISDPRIKLNFDWILLQSGYSSIPIDKFYPEFKSLLERARPSCKVLKLQELIDAIELAASVPS